MHRRYLFTIFKSDIDLNKYSGDPNPNQSCVQNKLIFHYCDQADRRISFI